MRENEIFSKNIILRFVRTDFIRAITVINVIVLLINVHIDDKTI